MSFKSFLGWLQDSEPGKNRAEQTAEDWKEKRRDNRVDLAEERPLVVHLSSEDGQGKADTLVARVKNVSVRGCGLIFKTAEEQARLKPRQILVASLDVDDFAIPLQVEVIRLVGDKEAAIRFKPPFPRELEKLEKFLEPRCLGRSLREIDRAKLQDSQQKGLRWFQGVNETHLFSWHHPETNAITQQQLIFLDRVVEWKEQGPVQTGLIRSDEAGEKSKMGWVKAELMDFDAVPDNAVLIQAKALLESAQIDDSIKKIFLKKFI